MFIGVCSEDSSGLVVTLSTLVERENGKSTTARKFSVEGRDWLEEIHDTLGLGKAQGRVH
ncbi:MAG: hypothetical protein H5U33_23915 [Pseudomonas sp.]|nr:hypothetical protein [Pseudomonas sp.]